MKLLAFLLVAAVSQTAAADPAFEVTAGATRSDDGAYGPELSAGAGLRIAPDKVLGLRIEVARVYTPERQIQDEIFAPYHTTFASIGPAIRGEYGRWLWLGASAGFAIEATTVDGDLRMAYHGVLEGRVGGTVARFSQHSLAVSIAGEVLVEGGLGLKASAAIGYQFN